MTDPSEYFSVRFTYDPRRAGVWRELVRFIRNDIVDRSALLELGCGYGDFINHVDADRKYAVDRSELVREHIGPDVRFVCGDCADLSFLEPASVGTVFASNLLEHLDRGSLERVMGEVQRVLAPRGRLILIQPNYRLCAADYFDDYTHVTVFSDVGLCAFLGAHGFRIVRCIPGLLPFSMQSRVPKYPWLVRLYLNCPVRPLAKQMYVVSEKA